MINNEHTFLQSVYLLAIKTGNTGTYIVKIGVIVLGQLGSVVQHVEHVHLARQVRRSHVEARVSLDAEGEDKAPLGVPRRNESQRWIEAQILRERKTRGHRCYID